MSRRHRAFTSLLAIALCSRAAAVVVSSGTANTSDPGSNPYFANVGQVNGASAIYLGNRWVMTAYHVASSLPASVTFGGGAYATQASSWQRVANTGPGLTAFTDIVLFRLGSDPGLSYLPLSNTAATTGDDVMLAGNGRLQQTSLTYWDVSVIAGPNNDVWTELGSPAGAEAAGFKTTSTKAVAWGVNEAASTGITVNSGNGDVVSFTTTFNSSGGFLHEGQAVNGDSGGAAFSFNGVSWVLAGMMHAVNAYENQPTVGGQPASTAIYGQSTFIADLSAYAPQIATVVGVPEPSAGWCLLALSSAFIRRRRSAV